MAIIGVDHVQIAMPAGREDDARDFYGRLLGLPERAKPSDLASRGGVWFEAGTVALHLGVEGDFRPARKAHPAFRVTDLRSLVARLREAHVAVVGDDVPEYRRVYVSDPFGNRIELIDAGR